jgi:tetratricopeptide (TPR) repeat protein
VSQSPVNDFSEQATLRYKQGWRALNRLLHEDRSFSGNERDCAFLNCGGDTPSFATVSAVTGFDFADDGRGLATADWDFDGDLDVWLTARTAPRVRFVKNNTAEKPFVAFKLKGTGGTNHDAIGARLDLHLRGAGRNPVRIRTLRGGEGFLSQSSNWVHFGLGDAAGIEKLVIRWPGGKPQEFTGIEQGKFYRLTQGKSTPETFSPPAGRIPLTTSTPLVPAMDESARIIVAPGLPLPQLTAVAPDGSTQLWEPKQGRATAVNIWASWCAPCIAELTEWSAHRSELTAAGLDVAAFNTDSPGDNPAASPADSAALAKKFSFSFPGARLSESGLHALDHLQRAVLDRWKPLPLPATFLTDCKGELIAIYKGPVRAAQLLADLKLAGADANQRRDASIPFPGVWVGDAGRADPQRVANLMLDHDEADAAIEYLERCVKVFASRKDLPGHKNQLGDIYFMAGLLQGASAGHRGRAVASLTAARDLIPEDLRIRKALARELLAAGRGDEAAAEMDAAIRINPGDLSLKTELEDLCEKTGQFEKARPILEELLAANPKTAAVRYRLAGVLVKLGDPRAAIQHYRQTLTDSPRTLEAANDLARLLAGHPDDSVRAADEALALARRLCAITKDEHAAFLDTLAIALANKGDFPQAISAARKAVTLLPADNKAAAASIRERIKLYEAGQPFRLGAGQP